MSQMYPFATDPPGDALWELDLYFTVSPGKTDFASADQHWRLKAKERFKIFGLLVDGHVATDLGDEVFAGGKKVGVINFGMYSQLPKNSTAIARLDVSVAVHGTRLEVRGKHVKAAAIARTLPYDDPEKKKRSAVG